MALSPAVQAQGNGKNKRDAIDPAGIARLVSESGGAVEVSLSDATGAARFVRAPRGRKLGLLKQAPRAQSDAAKQGRTAEFLSSYGSVFGISNAGDELQLVRVGKNRGGGTHIVYRQVYRGLPVFAGELRSHFDESDELVAVNGSFVPAIALDPNPSRSAGEASQTAIARVKAEADAAGELAAAAATLLVFREGLIQGVDGPSHLAWQVEVSDGASVREYVYVDAHTGKFIDQITGTPDGRFRRAYNAQGFSAPGPNYPGTPFWVEGDPFPTFNAEADNMILASGETYGLFDNAFGRDSFDAVGGTMDSIFNRGNGCPNASWNGTFISFCPGTTSDDVTAHEWGHAYTQYTHNLIYQWQPGALNESYSDIWGEVVDFLNGRGTDAPGGLRSADSCTAFTSFPPRLRVNSPASIAGNYPAGAAQFGPALTAAGLTGSVVLADDGVGAGTPPALSVTDGCETPWVNAAAVAGEIALVDRGTCGFAVKVKNAQLNGAIGVIVANHVTGGNGTIGMAGVDPTITIPSLSVGFSNGNIIKSELAAGVNATLRVSAPAAVDNSYRWLMGEDATAFGGAIRDMWNPTCYGHPGKVSDSQYTCSTSDNGGVHSNSGIPNHAFALIADGGSYNSQTVAALGLTKAAHIYYRAMSVYQGLASDFADHADAIEQSCSDLIGANLADLATGAPSGQAVSASDCSQVAKAMLAVEMRTPPTQCGFQPLLAQNPPALCSAGGKATQLFHDSFDSGNSSMARWSVSHTGLTADFTPRDWQVVGALPDQREGRAFFGVDPNIGSCAPGGDESGVLHLVSPKITIPASVSAPMLTFDHWVATEPGWDGGNLKISVNGGPWQIVQGVDFVYNPYNASLFTAGQGNTNPLAGQPAFTGSDGGAVDGSWGRSIVKLAPYAAPKDKIQLRFDVGTDGCSGSFGWYIDDLMVYKCH